MCSVSACGWTATSRGSKSPEWNRHLRYKPDTMVTEVRCATSSSARADVPRRRRLLQPGVFPQDAGDRPARLARAMCACSSTTTSSVGGSPVGDTVNYDPASLRACPLQRRQYFLINGCDDRKRGHRPVGHRRQAHRTTPKAPGATPRTASSARNPIAQGSVDSTVGFNLLSAAQRHGHVHLLAGWPARDYDERQAAQPEKIIERRRSA